MASLTKSIPQLIALGFDKVGELIGQLEWLHGEMAAIGNVLGKQDGRVLDVNELSSNFIGQSVVLLPPLPAVFGSSNFSAIIDARSRNPNSPQVVTIDLGFEVDTVPAGAAILPQARITWGCGGAKFVAIVDVLKGAQISVAANYLVIEGIYTTLSTTTIDTARISANLSYGTRPGSARGAHFTSLQQTALAAGMGVGPAVFTIPNFAKDVTVYSTGQAATDAAPGDLLIDFGTADDAGTAGLATILQNQLTAPNGVPSRTFPIPGFARTLRVFNTGMADMTVIPVFGLAL